MQAYDNNVLQKTTDYIDGAVYENGTLSNFAMAKGRVRNTGSALKAEYMIADHQGNVGVSFEEQNGQAVVRQDLANPSDSVLDALLYFLPFNSLRKCFNCKFGSSINRFLINERSFSRPEGSV